MNGQVGAEVTIASLLQKMGDDITFVEVGVLRATTVVYIANNCMNVSSIVGIDLYEPYVDKLVPQVQYSVNPKLAAMNRRIAEDKIRNCSRPEIIKMLFMDCVEAVHKFDNKSIDCIKAWLPKVKSGGLLLGHDVHTLAVSSGLLGNGINYLELDNNVWMHKV